MKKLFLLLFSISFYHPINAQVNLVPNPSFELYDTCPYRPSQLRFVTPWYSPTSGLPDYYNQCSIGGGAFVPTNPFGFQYAHSGAAYVGLVIYGQAQTFGPYNEYIQVKLNDSLKANKNYSVHFYVSNSALGFGENMLAITEIGMLFSNNSITTSNWGPLIFNPQIKSPAGVFMSDSVNWMQISGTYTALGGERYITIGNFKSDAAVDTMIINHGTYTGAADYYAYYYIDDVSVVASDSIQPQEIPNVFTPNKDGINDNWIVKNLPAGTKVQLFDRWGNEQVRAENVEDNFVWDGYNSADVACVDGVYFYIITTPTDTFKGFLQLLR